MQLDMFGASDESAVTGLAPPVLDRTTGTWMSPEARIFNEALQAGDLSNALAILNQLKTEVVSQVLLQSGFTLGYSKSRDALMRSVQSDIVAASRLRVSGKDLWDGRAVEFFKRRLAGENPRPIATDIREGDLLRVNGAEFMVTGRASNKVVAERPNSVEDSVYAHAHGQKIFLDGPEAVLAKIERAAFAAGVLKVEMYADTVHNALNNDENLNKESTNVSNNPIARDIWARPGAQDKNAGSLHGERGQPLDAGVAEPGSRNGGKPNVLVGTVGPSGSGEGYLGGGNRPDPSGGARNLGTPPGSTLPSSNDTDRSASGLNNDLPEAVTAAFTKEIQGVLHRAERLDHLSGGSNISHDQRNALLKRALTMKEIHGDMKEALASASAQAFHAISTRDATVFKNYQHLFGETYQALASYINTIAVSKSTPAQAVNASVELQAPRVAIAARYAQALAENRQGASSEPKAFHFKFADDLLARDVLALRWLVNGNNDIGKKIFSEFTGVKLPRGQAVGWIALREWGGLTPQQDAERLQAEASAHSNQERAQRNARTEQDALTRVYRLSESGLDSVNGKQLVDGWIGEGFSEIVNISKTAVPRYGLRNPLSNVYYPLDKVTRAYAVLALERLSAESRVATGVNIMSMVNAAQAANQDQDDAHEAADAQAKRQTFIDEAQAAHLFGLSTRAVHAVGDRVELTKPNALGGKPINIGGLVSRILPNGELEVRTQLDGYMTVPVDKLGHISHEEWKARNGESSRTVLPPAIDSTEPQIEKEVEQTLENYVLSDADRLGLGSLGEKFQDNLRAIQVLHTLKSEQRDAVGDELRALARYVGWGGLKGVLDPQNKQWAKQHGLLRSLLTDTQWNAARRSQLDAFYTSPIVASAMYSAIQRLGFDGGRVLEPSVGVGNFFGLMPVEMRNNSQLFGVELDVLTSEIVSALYPRATIAKATGFENFRVPSGYFDLAIGNPPFGSQGIVDDRGSAYSGWSIHNYFFAKSIDLLRPGGVMSMVVSHNFLDKLDPHVRKWISRRAELVSGVRLPNTAFKVNANTEVVTDVLVFRRLDFEHSLDTGSSEPDWLKTTDVSIENHKTGSTELIAINNYFLNNPQNVLGTNSTDGSMYRANEYTVLANGDLEQQLAQWVLTLPQSVYVPLERTATNDRAKSEGNSGIEIPEHVKVGSFFAVGTEVWIRDDDRHGQRQAVRWESPNLRASERVLGMIAIREVLRRQMRLERGVEAGDIEEGRQRLNAAYDDFQKRFGYLNDSVNRKLFADDTESPLVQALEFDYEKAITALKAEEHGIEPRPAKAAKADILSRRVLFPPGEIEVVESARDALLHSLNATGRVDMPYMQSVYAKSEKEIIGELGDLLFLDPVAGLVTADEYLSGDVKTKVSEATAAAKNDASLLRNVEALQRVIPADKLPSEIYGAIGAAWIPASVFAQFAREISGAPVSFVYVGATGQWLKSSVGAANYALNNSEYGTERLGALEIFVLAMNLKVPEIKKKVDIGGEEKWVTDEPATEAVRQKAEKIRAHWDSWLWSDSVRAQQLSNIYNDRFNRIVERKFDGSHLTFPGMSANMSLLAHQKNGVWRGLQDRVLLLDQAVGAGKTFEVAALVMEMRRLGIAKKVMLAVPNHLTLQWRSEIHRLYPGANVLAATPQDFEKDSREKFFSKIVTGNWDAVIVGHSSLKKIMLPPGAEMDIVREQVTDITDAIEAIKQGRGDRNVVRDLEKIKANLEAKVQRLRLKAGSKDKVIDFGDLGVDGLAIDELHEFKNLFFTTQMNRVSGLGNPAGSGKAFDLFTKVRWMQKTYGERSPWIGATGTPISNSLAEMFTMQRFMQYSRLKSNGLHVFDAWARQYGDVQTVYEVAPSGTGYRLSQRFSKFKNLGSLMSEYRSFSDVITLSDLKAQEIAAGRAFPVPKIAGGRPLNVVANRSPLQEKFFGVPEIVRDDVGNIVFEANMTLPTSVFKDTEGKFRVKQIDTDTQGVEFDRISPKGFETASEAALALSMDAITPKMTIDPNSIVGQFENLRELTRATKGKINALSLTGLANKAGLDYRLIDPSAQDFRDSKINLALGRMLEIGRSWDARKGVQLVFCDLSVPLSARAKMATKEKRIYVRDSEGNLVHRKGTLHTVKEYEGLPYFLVVEGKAKEKTFSMYDPITGHVMKTGLDSKAQAHAFASQWFKQPDGPERWLDGRERSPAITREEIDEYRNEHTLDTEGDAADLEVSLEDIEGVAGAAEFSVYDDMKAKLIAAGVAAHQIEFIHDHDTPQAKDLLFKRVNSGDVRYLFGSTPKMGAGTNVQQRLVGLHHIDAPWRPSDLEQREGRIVRRGNLFYEADPEGFQVHVNRYATSQTYDTRRWQLLEHKASGLEQLRNYTGANEIEDVANEAANSADMKAAASGNPLILKETQLSNEVKKLRLLERGHRDSDFLLHARERSLRAYAEIHGPVELERWETIKAQRDSAGALGVYKGHTLIDRDQVMDALDKLKEGLAALGTTHSLVYRGLKFGLTRQVAMDARGLWYRVTMPDGRETLFDVFSRSGFVTRMDNWVERIDAEIDHVRARMANSALQASEIAPRLGAGFEHAQALAQAIEDHGNVQRELMKSNSIAAVRPSEAMEFQLAVKRQKLLLQAAGFADAVAELEMSDQPLPTLTDVAPEAAVGDAATTPNILGAGLDMEPYIKVAAQDITQLRKPDVYRVLVESNRAELSEDIAAFITSRRPDLANEVAAVMRGAVDRKVSPNAGAEVELPSYLVQEGVFHGRVLSVHDGVVTQSINRQGEVVCHDLSRLSGPVQVDELVEVRYSAGVGVVQAQEVTQGVQR